MGTAGTAEITERFGLEWLFKLIQCHPCHGRDTFHCPRLLPALSSLALGTSRDPGAATASQGNPFQALPTLTGEKFIPSIPSKPEEDDEELPEFQVSGKIGAKKQRKLEEKQARRAQREVRISCHVLSREEEKRKAKEEEEKREYEEYLKLKESFVVEEEGVEESMTEEQVCEAGSAVLLLDLGASHCSLCPAGVIDDRGKFIYITAEEMAAVAQYIKQRGRVSIAELAQASNSLINLQPDSRAVAPTLA
uniref:DDRGK domain containing 1 n=1 Tax=Serinus canaria TaxID=9135 RepID=A0A8C9N426_SERCA